MQIMVMVRFPTLIMLQGDSGSAPDDGTTVSRYIEPAPYSTSGPADQQNPKFVAQRADALLHWIMRIVFALLGVFFGALIYSDATEITNQHTLIISPFPIPVLVGTSLFIAWLIRSLSRAAQWGTLAAILALLSPSALYNGWWRCLDSLNGQVDQNIRASGITIVSEYSRGFFFLASGIGLAVLATFSMLQSLPRIRGWLGVPIVAAIIAGGIMVDYRYGVAYGTPDFAMLEGVHEWGG